MKAFVAVTDNEWFGFLRRRPDLSEVNFWQPGGGRDFRVLSIGQPLLFKLHYPQNFVVGGGFFAAFSRLPVSMAWETFGPQNGVASLEAMRARVERYRRVPPASREDYEIGCIVLADPFFLEEGYWLPAPSDFSKNIVTGKSYDLRSGAGAELWAAVTQARAMSRHLASDNVEMYGDPALFRPRLGQGAFRLAVTDAYGRHCAVTREHTLPVLEAAHIRPVASGGVHSVSNGILLRSDLHTLFDRGYVTVTPDYEFRVSRRLRTDWKNGKPYYALDGAAIDVPQLPSDRPGAEALEWHAGKVFLG